MESEKITIDGLFPLHEMLQEAKKSMAFRYLTLGYKGVNSNEDLSEPFPEIKIFIRNTYIHLARRRGRFEIVSNEVRAQCSRLLEDLKNDGPIAGISVDMHVDYPEESRISGFVCSVTGL